MTWHFKPRAEAAKIKGADGATIAGFPNLSVRTEGSHQEANALFDAVESGSVDAARPRVIPPVPTQPADHYRNAAMAKEAAMAAVRKAAKKDTAVSRQQQLKFNHGENKAFVVIPNNAPKPAAAAAAAGGGAVAQHTAGGGVPGGSATATAATEARDASPRRDDAMMDVDAPPEVRLDCV